MSERLFRNSLPPLFSKKIQWLRFKTCYASGAPPKQMETSGKAAWAALAAGLELNLLTAAWLVSISFR